MSCVLFVVLLTVIVVLGAGGSMSEAADAGARDMADAELVEGTMRVLVIDGGAIVSDALINAGELYKRRGLAKAYQKVGMQQEMQRYFMEYMTQGGVQSFQEAAKELIEHHRNKAPGPSPVVPINETWYQWRMRVFWDLFDVN